VDLGAVVLAPGIVVTGNVVTGATWLVSGSS
jgi:hypothetical protein